MFPKLLFQATILNQIVSNKLHYSPIFTHFDYKANLYRPGPPDKGKLWTPYNIVNCFVQLFLMPANCLFVLIWQAVFNPGQASLTVEYIYAVFFLGCSLGTGWTIVLYWTTEDTALHSNQLLAFHKLLEPSLNPQEFNVPAAEIMKDLWQEIKRISKTGKGDIVGIGAILFVLGVAVAPPSGATMTSLLIHIINLDDETREDTINANLLFKWYSSIFGETFVGDLIVRICLFIVALIFDIELCRIYRLVIVQFLFVGSSTISLLKMIRITGETNRGQSLAVERYKILYQIHNNILYPSKLYFFLALKAGCGIIVLSLAAAVVGWKVLTPSGYSTSVEITIMGLFVVVAGLPIGMYPVQFSQDMINSWKFRIDRFPNGSKRLNKMVLASLRPIGFPVGGKGIFDKQVGNDIMSTIIFNTTDLILFLMSFS